ncbi:SDR family oxidoreductase [Halieaceae bacterium IMCC14734]|uniref:SDR family oxidoreductase n=1 Tax=Candidatus Litorirhabdus singularis TaxID=2518993 RepID=A0ABT3TL89_9GAMM|nr:SDR family NAD(P)-dependent oxidoreductase [Candidatus Litorirhabdus singularis]MCX2983031.1 SDR family oxidoreductase [Candidatus Litorirhabdus singularis]
MQQIEGRVAVVTGAGSGIGRAVSLELAACGADVALVDVSESRLQEVLKDIEALGRHATLHTIDVSDREQMQALPEQVIALHGAVHILVNNAGVSVNLPFAEQSLEDLEWISGINYWGVMYGCKYFLPYLQQQDEAHIVNMSSSAGLTGMAGQSSYAATKFAVRGLSESLYVELAATNVGITCVHPGAVATNIVADARMEADHKAKMLKMFHLAMPPEKAARLIVKAIRRQRFKLVFCVESRVLDFMKRILPVSTLRLMRWFKRRQPAVSDQVQTQ